MIRACIAEIENRFETTIRTVEDGNFDFEEFPLMTLNVHTADWESSYEDQGLLNNNKLKMEAESIIRKQQTV